MGICWAVSKKKSIHIYCLQMDTKGKLGIKTNYFTIIRRPAPLLPSLIEVTAGTHEATNHGCNDGHKQQNGRGDPGYSGGAEERGQQRA